MKSKFNIFKRWPIILAVAVSATVASFVWAMASQPTEAPIRNLQTTVANQTGQVVEFFWYDCPHCEKLDLTVEYWAKALPKTVSFSRVPVAFGESGVHQQRMHYSLLHMGKLNELRPAIFKAIHEDHIKLDSPGKIAQWVSEHGVDRKAFEITFDSAQVTADILEAHRLEQGYGVQSVPSIGVFGKTHIGSSRLAATDMLAAALIEVNKVEIGK